MENLQIYRNEKLGLNVRGLLIEGKPYFAGVDIARALGYRNPKFAIANRCKDRKVVYDELDITEVDYISNYDVVRLVDGSKVSNADEIENWILNEIVYSMLQIDRYKRAMYNYIPDKMVELDLHPLSENQMYSRGYTHSYQYERKLEEFNEKAVPKLPPLEHFGVDKDTKEVVVWYGFKTVAPELTKSGKGYDTTNLIKMTQDMIFNHYGIDDVVVKFCHCLMISEDAESYDDGKIYFYMRPLEPIYDDEPIED